MLLTTGRMKRDPALSLCRWFLTQDDLGDGRRGRRLIVRNIDGRRLHHNNFKSVEDLLVADARYYQHNPHARFPFDITIESDDEDLLLWIKMKFL